MSNCEIKKCNNCPRSQSPNKNKPHNCVHPQSPKSPNKKKCHIPRLLPLGKRNIRFLTNNLSFIDARPVFSPEGNFVIFTRQPNNGDPNALSALYMIPTDGSTQTATILFAGSNPKTYQQFNVTRPDFSWTRKHFQIAFDGGANNGIWLLDLKTKKIRQVLEPVIKGQSFIWSYPAWYPDGDSLIVTNYNDFSTTSSAYHQLVKANIHKLNTFEVLTDNQKVWPGMSSVSQAEPKLITFAGQLPVTPQPPSEPPTCINGGIIDPDGYAQNCNQIWLQKGLHDPFQIDPSQGRAPWFSHDGKFIVFESNRANSSSVLDYRIFLYSLKDSSIQPLTPPSINVQHAKWSPNGKQIVFAVQLFEGAQGIAIMDVFD